MVTQPKAREHLARAVLTDPRMPSELDVLLQEADGDGRDGAKTLPLLLVEFDQTSRPDKKTTSLVGYKTDDDGNRIAKVYEDEWQATAHVELWTADGSTYDVDTLGNTLTSVLYGYQTRTTDDPFLDSNGDPVPDMWHFDLLDAFRADDLVQTPTVRRWRQRAEVYGAQEYVEQEQPPVTSVVPDVENDETATNL